MADPQPPGKEAEALTPEARKKRWRKVRIAVFVWVFEAVIGLIPYIAHAASASLAVRPDGKQPISELPELCILAVVASALALLSLLRDWFTGEATEAKALTVILAVANVLACLAAMFLYPLAVNDLLTTSGHGAPALMLVASLVASFFLAAERGWNSRR